MATVRVALPYHLRNLAGVSTDEVAVRVDESVSVVSVIRGLERDYPMLRGTMLEHNSEQRRPKVRFFACSADVSLGSLRAPLPEAVAAGVEALLVVGAVSGG